MSDTNVAAAEAPQLLGELSADAQSGLLEWQHMEVRAYPGRYNLTLLPNDDATDAYFKRIQVSLGC